MPAASLNGHARSELAASVPALQVRVLGPVEVHRDGAPLPGLAPLTLQILVYLASHRDGVTPERLDDVIWNGQLASPNSQRLRSALTKLRNTLGKAPDGEPFLPRRQHRTDPIRLAGPVTTDLDQAIEHLEHARAVTGTERLAYLDRALDHVRGAPIAGWIRRGAGGRGHRRHHDRVAVQGGQGRARGAADLLLRPGAAGLGMARVSR